MSNPYQPQQPNQQPQQPNPQPPQPHQQQQPILYPPQPHPMNQAAPMGPPGSGQIPQPKKKGRVLPAVITGVICLIVGAAIGGAGDNTTTASPGAPGATVTATATKTVEKPGNTKTVTVTEKPAAEETKQAEPAAKGAGVGGKVIDDGQWLVGTKADIAPGKYRTKDNAEDVGNLCYADTSTDGGDIIAQEVTDKGKTIIIISAAADTFKSSDCGEWEKVG